MTTRRKLVAGAIAAAVAAGSSRSRAQAPIQIRISTAAPPSDFLTKALNQLKADVDKAPSGSTSACIRPRRCSSKAPRCPRCSAAISK